MYKGHRNRPMNAAQSVENHKIRSERWVVERTFRSLKRVAWLGKYAIERTAGVPAAHVMQAVTHNLKRFPGSPRQ